MTSVSTLITVLSHRPSGIIDSGTREKHGTISSGPFSSSMAQRDTPSHGGLCADTVAISCCVSVQGTTRAAPAAPGREKKEAGVPDPLFAGYIVLATGYLGGMQWRVETAGQNPLVKPGRTGDRERKVGSYGGLDSVNYTATGRGRSSRTRTSWSGQGCLMELARPHLRAQLQFQAPFLAQLSPA